jgi:hypothetical protein
MSDFFGTRRPRAADYGNWLQVTVLIGVVVLAVAAFWLSYAGIREIAVAAGVSPARAGLYPLIFDASLVVASLVALGLRGAGWWVQGFAWLSIMVLLAAVAVVEALHAAGISFPQKPAAGVMAAIPWTLLLLGFGLWLSMLRYLRIVRAVNPPGDLYNGSASTAGRWGPAVNQRPTGWVAVPDADDRDGPDVRLLPPRPRPAVPDADDRDGPNAGFAEIGQHPPTGRLTPHLTW